MFAIDDDFDAGRRRRGRASGKSYLYPASSMLARCVREPMQSLGVPPSFALNLHNGISPTDSEWFSLGSTSDGMQLLIRKDWQTVGTSGGPRAEIRSAVGFSPLGRTWHAGHMVDFRGRLNSF
jgi:hypothetical protein